MGGVALPYDIELEKQVLGALLVRSDLVVGVSPVVKESDFFSESHRIIYNAIVTLSVAGSAVDPVMVIQHLKDRSLLASVGDATYLLRLAEDAITPSSAPSLARRIRSLATRRELILAVRQIEQSASQPAEDENQFLKSVSDTVLRITNRSAQDGIVRVAEIADDFMGYIQKLIEARGGLSGLATGFTEFDNYTSGLKGGELIILAARPGMGKTTLAMNIAANVAMRNKKAVLIISLEMGRMELLLRMLCSETQMNLGDIKKGIIPREKVQPIQNGIAKITQSPIHIEDSGTVDIWDTITLARRLAVELEQKGETLGLIIIDYLQLISDPESRKQGRQNEVASVSRSLKQLARMTNTPIIALSQMNRGVEQRKGEKPQLSDLRESGALEQDADMVLFIHREMAKEGKEGEVPSQEELENRGTAEIIIAKHRNGAVGSFRLAFRPEINRFDNRPNPNPVY